MSPCDSPLSFHTFLPIVLVLTPAAGIQDMLEGANTVAAERALRVGLSPHLNGFEGVGSVSSVAFSRNCSWLSHSYARRECHFLSNC